jgi:tetratricopeptide (TPR) repeat protein
MNLLNSIRNLFKKKSRDLTEKTSKLNKRLDAYEAYWEDEKLYSARKYQDAIDCFDRAIESGYYSYKNNIYESRAHSLRALDLDLDAIDDFSKAISFAPEDANNYFGRGLSRETIGDFDGCISDYKEAIRLSKIESKLNDYRNNIANKSGATSAAAGYEGYLSFAQQQRESFKDNPEEWQDRLVRRPINCRRTRKQGDYQE